MFLQLVICGIFLLNFTETWVAEDDAEDVIRDFTVSGKCRLVTAMLLLGLFRVYNIIYAIQ